MESGYGGGGGKPQIPPLMETTSFGTLQYVDGPGAGQPVKLEINGTIDKGFFLSEKEWTCYRRNYFSCICSFAVSPHYPASGMTFLQNNGTRNSVHGFSMSISAVVSDNDNHTIELVQHTPKRDKGPTARPEKVHLIAKPPQPAHHNMGLYTDSGISVGGRYDHAYGPPQAGHPTEHTFERIQFKQATANNGKRRAAQQYYHLLVELWAEVGAPGSSDWHSVKVAHRKSAKMIVRGRSPGHYQPERRGSTSSGPGGSAGSLGGYGGSQIGSDYNPTSTMMPTTYGNTYDPRSSHYGATSRQHSATQPPLNTQISHPVMSQEEIKSIQEPREYQYYPTPICDGTHEPRQPVELYSHAHQRGDHDTVLPHMSTSALEVARTKGDGSHHSPTFYPGDTFYSNRCGRYEGKSSTSGYYPSLVSSASSVTMS
ncbi:meiosis-specific transcription factor ndt80 [Sporothrix eucalyptigena]|uniref:Meiosis-specific transcription factor ndt80 n=1 Tax=Sporothrix eucalyptigena TaxID=1812306 RepID=A0ABP0ARA0_9PEZI